MTTSTRLAGAGLGIFGAFQAALALGAPWGAAAYGGAHPGALPTGLRIASGISALAYAVAAAAVASDRGGRRARRVAMTALSAAMLGGTVLNLISPSLPEKAWAALCLCIAVTAWLGRPPQPLRSDDGRRPGPA